MGTKKKIKKDTKPGPIEQREHERCAREVGKVSLHRMIAQQGYVRTINVW